MEQHPDYKYRPKKKKSVKRVGKTSSNSSNKKSTGTQGAEALISTLSSADAEENIKKMSTEEDTTVVMNREHPELLFDTPGVSPTTSSVCGDDVIHPPLKEGIIPDNQTLVADSTSSVKDVPLPSIPTDDSCISDSSSYAMTCNCDLSDTFPGLPTPQLSPLNLTNFNFPLMPSCMDHVDDAQPPSGPNWKIEPELVKSPVVSQTMTFDQCFSELGSSLPIELAAKIESVENCSDNNMQTSDMFDEYSVDNNNRYGVPGSMTLRDLIISKHPPRPHQPTDIGERHFSFENYSLEGYFYNQMMRTGGFINGQITPGGMYPHLAVCDVMTCVDHDVNQPEHMRESRGSNQTLLPISEMNRECFNVEDITVRDAREMLFPQQTPGGNTIVNARVYSGRNPYADAETSELDQYLGKHCVETDLSYGYIHDKNEIQELCGGTKMFSHNMSNIKNEVFSRVSDVYYPLVTKCVEACHQSATVPTDIFTVGETPGFSITSTGSESTLDYAVQNCALGYDFTSPSVFADTNINRYGKSCNQCVIDELLNARCRCGHLDGPPSLNNNELFRYIPGNFNTFNMSNYENLPGNYCGFFDRRFVTYPANFAAFEDQLSGNRGSNFGRERCTGDFVETGQDCAIASDSSCKEGIQTEQVRRDIRSDSSQEHDTTSYPPSMPMFDLDFNFDVVTRSPDSAVESFEGFNSFTENCFVQNGFD